MTLSLWTSVAGLLGCAPSQPTFQAVLDGSAALSAGDRAAVEALLSASGTAAGDVSLLAADDSLPASVPAVRVEDGRVTGLVLTGVTDASAAGRLDALRGLRLAGSFPHLRLDDAPALGDLDLRSTGGELRELKLGGAPGLERLRVDGARAAGLPDLTGLVALRNLALTRMDLDTIPPLGASGVAELDLSGNHLADLSGLAGLDGLGRLVLADNQLTSLDTLPPLPRLRRLDLSGNPVSPDLGLPRDYLPELKTLVLRRTGLAAPPAALADADVEVELDPGVAERANLRATLERLREQRDQAPGELVTSLGHTSGEIRGRSGDCRWHTSTSSPARVDCDLRFDSLTGTADARLGETDPAMPFQGGGHPRVRVTLTVGSGAAAVYVREERDLIQDLATIARVTDEEVDPDWLEENRRPDDRFNGYRRVVARPGQPATVSGDVVVLGSRVVLWVEAVDGEAGDLRLAVASI